MILLWLILLPFVGGLVALFSGRLGDRWSRSVSLVTMVIHLGLVVVAWIGCFTQAAGAHQGPWLLEMRLPWIDQAGISFHLAVDGMSLLLVSLASFLGTMAVLASWTEIKERAGLFHFNLLWCLSGIVGVFLAVDLFLFYFLWELMLVPMYFLIALWGHENRAAAATKFFIFTQLSGLFMLASILGLYFAHGQATGRYTFDYPALVAQPLASIPATLLFLGFLAAFAVKLPAVPLHTWLPDAHTEAPTAGSILLAGLLLKTGAYGLIRFALPLFPHVVAHFAGIGMVVGVIGILYGAILAFVQTDLKRLVAYTSVSHMGFVLLAIAAGNELALEGAIIQMISHGLSTGALFALAGALQERTRTRDLRDLGGLWLQTPRLGGAVLFFALASLGLPGLGNFVGEFLIFLGAFHVSISLTVVAVSGLIASSLYSLTMVQKVFFGPSRNDTKICDLSVCEMAGLGAAMAALLWIGLYPNVCIRETARSLNYIANSLYTQATAARTAHTPPHMNDESFVFLTDGKP
ncbi:MAG TPA: NADH-quinone oxidoreductase subunit M [Syntrophorhabdaceae bacterium]|nr:NADH-quinone oxidoreductase subunit M [Syntrophorhabdaceae bacterium]